MPNDATLIACSCEALGLKDAVACVIGQMDESLGVLLFASLDAYELYQCAAMRAQLDDEPMEPPSHAVLSFERGADIAATMRKEIDTRRWEVAGPSAYPWLVVVEEGLYARAPHGQELAGIEAVARGLTKLVRKKKALQAAWYLGAVLMMTASLKVQGKLV